MNEFLSGTPRLKVTMDRFALAADLGGTNLRIAVVDKQGGIVFRRRFETPQDLSHEQFISLIAKHCRDCLNDSPSGPLVIGFGFAVPAVLDIDNGLIVESPNLPYLNGLAAAELLSAEIGLRTVLENDATAAAIGEDWLGAAKSFLSTICITLGTGVGGGIIFNGRPLRGIDGTAGEVGHINVEPNGFPCGCGSWGCLEQYASATGIEKMIAEVIEGRSDLERSVYADISPKRLYEMAKAGDEIASGIFDRMGAALGLAIAGLVNVLNPEVIVLGGGLSASWDLFIGKLKETLSQRAFRRPAERVKILRAELGDDAGLIGAASLIFDLKETPDATVKRDH